MAVYSGVYYDPNTDYSALMKNTTDPNQLSGLNQQRAAKIYDTGMSQYYDSVPEQYRGLQNLGKQTNTYKSPYSDQVSSQLAEITKMLKTPTTYDPNKDTAFQAGQKVIGDNTYRDMARRGIADSNITGQQAYQLSMQALPQYQANWQNQQQQNLGNQLALLTQLGNLDNTSYDRYNTDRTFDFNKGVSIAGLT